MKTDIFLNQYIDHTNLKPDASNDQIKQLCKEAKEYNFKAVCVHPSKLPICVQELQNSPVLICTVVGFPLGQNTTLAKAAETIDAIDNGADEIDMVINIAELKNHNKFYCIKEINEVVSAAQGRVVKVIVETALLNEEEKIYAFETVNESQAQYIKTSTGFASKGAELKDIEMWDTLRRLKNSNLKIKAAGGISTYDDLVAFILAGADRIGTSRSVSILKNRSLQLNVMQTINYEVQAKDFELKSKREIKNDKKFNKKPEDEQKNNEKEVIKGEIKIEKKQNKNDNAKDKNEKKVKEEKISVVISSNKNTKKEINQKKKKK